MESKTDSEEVNFPEVVEGQVMLCFLKEPGLNRKLLLKALLKAASGE
ncbi:MAG: hypothetical protein OEZ51_05705 [Nitrospinota bacterium]|nr:hypothetical protein [Nitrospinota bacterium]